MSGIRREWHDSGSSSGHLQTVADSGTFNRAQTAYRAYLNHATECDGCVRGEKRCPAADRLWRAYRDARTRAPAADAP